MGADESDDKLKRKYFWTSNAWLAEIVINLICIYIHLHTYIYIYIIYEYVCVSYTYMHIYNASSSPVSPEVPTVLIFAWCD